MSCLPTQATEGSKGTPGRIVKVDHAGEFGAINIYRAQILMAHVTARALLPVLRDFKAHEQRHLRVFWAVMEARGIRRCRSYYFCGLGGWCLGALTGLLGRGGIYACTAAVEEVVARHLRKQIAELEEMGDIDARDAVASILADEESHQSVGYAGSKDYWLYRPIRCVVGASTEFVIRLGMAL